MGNTQDGRTFYDALEIESVEIPQSATATDMYAVKRSLMLYESFVRQHGPDIFASFDAYCGATQSALRIALDGLVRSNIANVAVFVDVDHVRLTLSTYTDSDELLVKYLAHLIHNVCQEKITSTVFTVRYALKDYDENVRFSHMPEVRVYYD